MKTKKIIIPFLFLSILTSCRKDYFQPQAGPVLITKTVSFSTDIMPILNPGCSVSGCHGSSAPAAGLDLTAANAYSSLFGTGFVDTTIAPETNVLYTQLSSGAMPKGTSRLSPTQIGYILAWIKQGAKNN